MPFVYSHEDEIRDARDKRCTGHGWTSIMGASMKMYSCSGSHLYSKGKWPEGGASERERVIQADGGEDERDEMS